MKSIRIASRQSDLARIQALHVGSVLQKQYPGLKVEHFFRPSLGDLNQTDPLWKMPEKGVFTEDFREGLLKGEFQMVVHSWKDLPVEDAPGTQVVATLPREDMRDLFLCKKEHWARVVERGRLAVFTSSPRRMHNLEPFFKTFLPAAIQNVKFESVRGNVPTRIQKTLDAKDIDGLVLAKAAWDRLTLAPEEEFQAVQKELKAALEQFHWMVLPLKLNPCAPAQGALAIEIAQGNVELQNLLQPIHCEDTWQTVKEEREVLKSHGGGCHQKIGVSVLTRPYGKITFARGENEKGEDIGKVQLSPQRGQQVDAEKSSPVFPTERRWFDRKSLQGTWPKEGHHFVARANALPVDYKVALGTCVWTSGLKTWERLAKRGIWVSGSVEGLGEHEDFRVKSLLPEKQWWKWTHSKGTQSAKFENTPSYELIPSDSPPDLNGKSNFYWMSGSSFELAAQAHPEILAANHYCGPGQTFSVIVRALEKAGLGGRVEVQLDYESWARDTWKG